ncbi:type II toxin-antitoxin system Phd/YefM family antitoxin [bacterium]|nr:type II toxin-antitoxin system Phd/YefM family antitoxin [bacterium]
MQGKWQMQEAENKLGEVIKQSLENGPQAITQQGRDIAIVISLDDYRKLLMKPEDDLVSFFRNSPLVGAIELNRDSSTEYRNITL